MADQTLTVTYSTITGKVTHSGLTGTMTNAVRAILTALGISFPPDSNQGMLIDPSRFTSAQERTEAIRRFNNRLDSDPNAFSLTDNLTLVLTSV